MLQKTRLFFQILASVTIKYNNLEASNSKDYHLFGTVDRQLNCVVGISLTCTFDAEQNVHLLLFLRLMPLVFAKYKYQLL